MIQTAAGHPHSSVSLTVGEMYGTRVSGGENRHLLSDDVDLKYIQSAEHLD